MSSGLLGLDSDRRERAGSRVEHQRGDHGVLEAYDLTGGLRAADTLAGCDHKTVAHYVALRDAGHVPGERPRRAMTLDEFLPKIEEWVERSNGLAPGVAAVPAGGAVRGEYVGGVEAAQERRLHAE